MKNLNSGCHERPSSCWAGRWVEVKVPKRNILPVKFLKKTTSPKFLQKRGTLKFSDDIPVHRNEDST